MNFLQSLILEFIFAFFLLKTVNGRVPGSLLPVLHISDNTGIWYTLSQYGNSSDSLRWLGSSLRQDLLWSLNLNNTRVHTALGLSTHLDRNLDCWSSHFYFLRRETLALSTGSPRQVRCAHRIDPLNRNRPDRTHYVHLLFTPAIQYFYGNRSYLGTEAGFSTSFNGILFFFIPFSRLSCSWTRSCSLAC